MADFPFWRYVKHIELQQTKYIVLSSCEAEYISITSDTCQCIWLKRLIGELIGIEMKPVKILLNNKFTDMLRKNGEYHAWTKQIDTRFHFVRDCVDDARQDRKPLCVINVIKMDRG